MPAICQERDKFGYVSHTIVTYEVLNCLTRRCQSWEQIDFSVFRLVSPPFTAWTFYPGDIRTFLHVSLTQGTLLHVHVSLTHGRGTLPHVSRGHNYMYHLLRGHYYMYLFIPRGITICIIYPGDISICISSYQGLNILNVLPLAHTGNITTRFTFVVFSS